jgi:hypothetical protein
MGPKALEMSRERGGERGIGWLPAFFYLYSLPCWYQYLTTSSTSSSPNWISFTFFLVFFMAAYLVLLIVAAFAHAQAPNANAMFSLYEQKVSATLSHIGGNLA